MEEKARQAFEARNAMRLKARDDMIDQETKEYLDKNYPLKTFEELIADKMKRKKLTREEAIRDIYKTSTKTNEDVNKEFGIEGE
jgi:asparagine synthetase A